MDTSSHRQSEIEGLLTKQTLHELVAAYSHAVDRLDEAAFLELFHGDAIIDSGVLRGEPLDFMRGFTEWIRVNAIVTSHAVTNEWFRIDGSQAVGESYVTALSRLRGEPADHDVLAVGRYFDRFERRDGKWKFSERRFVLDHTVTLAPATAAP
jgi:SnoaL-like domain